MEQRVLDLKQLARIAVMTDTLVFRCACVTMLTGEVVDERTLISYCDAAALSYYGDALVLEGKIDLEGTEYLIGVVEDSEVTYVHQSGNERNSQRH